MRYASYTQCNPSPFLVTPRMANPSEADRAILRLLYDLHQKAERGRLGQVAAGELVESATSLNAAWRTTSNAEVRSSLARVLLTLYIHLSERLRLAPTNADGLPDLPGIGWTSHSPLAGLLEDIPPFSAADEWAGTIGLVRAPRQARRGARRPRGVNRRQPGPLGVQVQIEEAQVMTFPVGVSYMPPLEDSDERNSAFMRALADQARRERERATRGEAHPGRESPLAVEVTRAANEALARACFDSPVAHRLIHHYSLGSGEALTLTRHEMRQLRAGFDLRSSRRSEQFLRTLRQVTDEGRALINSGTMNERQLIRNTQFEVTGVTPISGTLGAFTGRCIGILTVIIFLHADPNWIFEGAMDWYDEWDFDSHAALGDEDLRSDLGTRRTEQGHDWLIGRPFRVGSEQIGIRQTNYDYVATLTYLPPGRGGFPPGEFDRY